MTNVEKLTARLNRCHNPRLVCNALLALAPVIREHGETFQGRTDGVGRNWDGGGRMTSAEIIRSMSEEQARRISPVVRAMKAKDLTGAKSVVEELTVDELDILIAFLEVKQAEVEKEHG